MIAINETKTEQYRYLLAFAEIINETGDEFSLSKCVKEFFAAGEIFHSKSNTNAARQTLSSLRK